MQSAWLLSLALIAVSVVDALSLHQRDAPAVFGLNIERRRISPGLLQRRASIVDVPFQFQPVVWITLFEDKTRLDLLTVQS
jgi:hypothetical protein